MTTFTKEQLQQIEAAAKEVLFPVVWSEKKARAHFSEKITPEVVLELARIALASLEAEAVTVHVDEIAEQAGIDPAVADAYMQGVNDSNQRKLADIIPSVIPEGLTGQIVYLCAFDSMPRYELANRIWNACRDAIVHTELSVRSECPWCDGDGYVEIDHGFEMGVEQKECRHCRAAMQGKAVSQDKLAFDNQVLSDLYHAQEKRLFKIAQRIKGPAFDKYAYSPSQAIDVLEAAIFGDSEVDRASMIAAAPQQEVQS